MTENIGLNRNAHDQWECPADKGNAFAGHGNKTRRKPGDRLYPGRRRKHYTGLAIFLCLSLALTACSESETSYFPLTQGYHWRYRIHVSTMSGREVQKFHLASLKPRVIKEKKTFVQRSLTGVQFLYRVTDIGIERIGYLKPADSATDFIEDAELILPTNAITGFGWESTVLTRTLAKNTPGEPGDSRLLARIPLKSLIESNTETVNVPAGKFTNCLKISSSGFAFYSGEQFGGRAMIEIRRQNWYAAGIGLVKSELHETSTSNAYASGELIMELESVDVP